MKNYSQQIEEAIAQLAFPIEPKGVYEPLRYILSLGGKRMRPVLTLAACEMFSGNANVAIPQALALEMFHNFTLIHDDIMDQAPLRRGNQTVHQKWNTNIAILSGDMMMIKAYQKLVDCNALILPNILFEFNKTATEVCEGQQMDMDFESKTDVTVSQYLEMIRLKTAVLLACALKIGALVGGASNDAALKCAIFGENLGIAFQLMDDYLDAFGNPIKFGKQPGGDILANKKTFLLISAMADANPNQKEILQFWLNKENPNPEEKIAAVKQVFAELQIEEKTKIKMQEYHQKALQALNSINLPDENKTNLLAFSEMLAIREV